MERILILFSFLFSLSTFAALPGSVPSIGTNAFGTTAPGIFLSPGNLGGTGNTGAFTLKLGDVSTNLVAGDFYPAYKNFFPYIVTTGKKAYCFPPTGIVGTVNNTFQFVEASAQFGYAATALVGGRYETGQPGKYLHQFTGANTYQAFPGLTEFDGASWVGFQAGGAQTYGLTMDCFEL